MPDYHGDLDLFAGLAWTKKILKVADLHPFAKLQRVVGDKGEEAFHRTEIVLQAGWCSQYVRLSVDWTQRLVVIDHLDRILIVPISVRFVGQPMQLEN